MGRQRRTAAGVVLDALIKTDEFDALRAERIDPAADASVATPLTASPDPMPDEGSFIRSDQYSFVRAGVPSLQLDLGYKSAEPGVDPLAVQKKWMVTIYHSPKDEASQPIDYVGSARFCGACYLLRREQSAAASLERKRFFRQTVLQTGRDTLSLSG